MRHLFIINPVATRVKGRVREISEEIESFFAGMGMNNYHIHVTRWARDGMGYVSRYALQSPEPVRVHAMGGGGMIYEVVNGTIGLPNTQIAIYPFGSCNSCVRYFGKNREYMFRSLYNQVFSDVTPVDAMRGDNIYGVGYALVGLEAISDRDSSEMQQWLNVSADLCNYYAAIRATLKIAEIGRHYRVRIDDRDYSGDYVSILIAGMPCYGNNMTPAPEAHPNDGLMDVYMIRRAAPLRLLSILLPYVNGYHYKTGGFVNYVRCKKISVSSEKDITLSVDGEIFCERSVSYKIVPAAIDLVCPDGIDVSKLPRLYNRPEVARGDSP